MARISADTVQALPRGGDVHAPRRAGSLPMPLDGVFGG
jgi:hypothetical protein